MIVPQSAMQDRTRRASGKTPAVRVETLDREQIRAPVHQNRGDRVGRF
jgi:hypothetical protein